MNIILIGYRGTGKSDVGCILARKLEMDYVGMDADIVAAAGMSIPSIVEENGWEAFRDLETAQVEKVLKKNNAVIDTGGGVIEREENRKILKQAGRVIWLTASADVIVDRIQDDTQRPALVEGKTFTEEVVEMLEKRDAKYREASEVTINTDDINPEQVAQKVIQVLGL